ncbi:hypothetical protein J562_4397, partial [Acinetobacter baumannii 1440750]
MSFLAFLNSLITSTIVLPSCLSIKLKIQRTKA